MIAKDILSLKLTEGWGIEVTINPFVWGAVFVVIVFIYLWRRRSALKQWEAVEVEIPFGGGKVKIVPNHEVVKIAHQAWTELVTRKAGLKFDDQNDVVAEVYNSWFELFKEIRLLIKSIPAHRLRESEDARQLVSLLVSTLNDGLRPHLTRWQARYRRWYKAAEAEPQHLNASPQEIQKKFPEYQLLTEDLKRINDQMIQFANELRRLAQSG